MRKTLIAALAVLAMTAANGMADEPAKATRGELIKISGSAEVAASDFEEYRLKDGRAAIRAQRPQQGVMLAFIGPTNDVAEVIALVNVSEKNFFVREAMLGQFAIVMTRWNPSAEWLIKAFAEIGKANGGERRLQINNSTLVVDVIPPATMRLSISRN